MCSVEKRNAEERTVKVKGHTRGDGKKIEAFERQKPLPLLRSCGVPFFDLLGMREVRVKRNEEMESQDMGKRVFQEPDGPWHTSQDYGVLNTTLTQV